MGANVDKVSEAIKHTNKLYKLMITGMVASTAYDRTMKALMILQDIMTEEEFRQYQDYCELKRRKA